MSAEMKWFEQIPLFLFGVSSLLPLINPVGTALILDRYFVGQDLRSRKSLSFTIVFYSFCLGLCTLFLGSWCLKFMGISTPTTQVAGGIVIAKMGLSMLNAKTETDSSTSGPDRNVRASLFYPMAFPLTLGPGGISTLIALSAHSHTPSLTETWMRMGVLSFSLLAVCVLTYFCFVYSASVIKRLGPSGSLVLNRLLAFLVFCVGIQMVVTGLGHLFPLLEIKT